MENNETKLSPVGMLLLGIICGWTNEALVFGLAVGLFLHFLFHRQELTRQRALLLLGFIIGFLFLALSPASINRFQVGISSSSSIWKDIFHRLVSALLAMENIRLLPLLMLLLLVFAGFRQIPNHYFKENDVLFYATGFSLFLVLATNHFSAHSRFGIELFSLILILRLVSPFLSKKSSVFIILFIGCFLCIAAPTVHFSYLNQKEYKRVIQQIQRRDSFIIQMEEVQIPKIYERLVLRFMPSEKSDYYHGFLGDPWIENYFGKRTLCFLPKRFLEASHKDSSFQEFDVHTDLPFYAKTITPDISIQEIKLILDPTNPKAVPLALRPFMNKFERWSVREIDVDRWRVLTLPQGQTFLLVGQNSMVHNRVSSIVVK